MRTAVQTANFLNGLVCGNTVMGFQLPMHPRCSASKVILFFSAPGKRYTEISVIVSKIQKVYETRLEDFVVLGTCSVRLIGHTAS